MSDKSYKLLLIGDVFGRPGRRMLEHELGRIQHEYDIDFTIVNAENASGGRGLNREGLHFFEDMGIDCLTMGNHTWDNKDIHNFIDRSPLIVRPLNYPSGLPGVGCRIYDLDGKKLAVVSLLGRMMMQVVADEPFAALEKLLPELKGQADWIVVDFHAEATSEKQALGRWLDGRVSVVVGTHTHVQTNDARILPGGTAYLTDLGMTGARDSIIGMAMQPAINRFRTGLPTKFEIADGPMMLNGAVVELLPNGKAKSIELINIEYEGF